MYNALSSPPTSSPISFRFTCPCATPPPLLLLRRLPFPSNAAKLHKELGLGGYRPQSFRYLRSSTGGGHGSSDDDDDGFDESIALGGPPGSLGSGDAEVWAKINQSMEVIGVSDKGKLDVWKILAGILHLGNAAITETDTTEGLKAHLDDKDEVNFDPVSVRRKTRTRAREHIGHLVCLLTPQRGHFCR